MHAIGSDGDAVFLLNCPDGPPTQRESLNLKLSMLNDIQGRLQSALPTLCAQWEKYHDGH